MDRATWPGHARASQDVTDLLQQTILFVSSSRPKCSPESWGDRVRSVSAVIFAVPAFTAARMAAAARVDSGEATCLAIPALRDGISVPTASAAGATAISSQAAPHPRCDGRMRRTGRLILSHWSAQRLRQIRHQIRCILDPDRQPQGGVGDAEGGALPGVQGAMRGACRMRDERARLADIHEMRE